MKIDIQKILQLNGWKTMELHGTHDFISVAECLCCRNILKTVATIIASHTADKINIGCCPQCGFVTYMDKPSHSWITNFYTSTWNTEEKNKQEFVNTNITSTALTEVLNKMDVSRNSRICEIGTGRGGNFAALIHKGYKNLVGVENSLHRAESVSKKFQVPIYAGGFEDEKVQTSLKQRGSYDVIYTAHVLEHVYDPAEMIELCSGLQNEGGYLIVAVPHFIGEPSMGVLSFLPHLHSFTSQAVTELLNRNGYAVIDDTRTTENEVFLVARKTKQAPSTQKSSIDFVRRAEEKFEQELLIKDMPLQGPLYYWFSKKDSRAIGVTKLSKIPLVRSFQERYWSYMHKNKGIRSLVLSKGDNDVTTPLTLVWANKITLFYK